MNQAFIVTKEHRRFTEFANAVRKEKTIGICHGAGMGKDCGRVLDPARNPQMRRHQAFGPAKPALGDPSRPVCDVHRHAP